MDPMTIFRKKRLRELIDGAPYHGSQAEFARAVGLTEGRVSQQLDPDESFGERSAQNIADELHLGDRYFEQGFEESDDQEFVEVRHVDVSFSNGHGQVVEREDDRPPLSFRHDFLRKLGIAPGKAVVVDAGGNSNYPKILPGAVVLINVADRDNLNGGFFAFRVNGELLIKRLDQVKGVGIVATAENSEFTPKIKVYTNRDELEVIGRAVWTGVEL